MALRFYLIRIITSLLDYKTFSVSRFRLIVTESGLICVLNRLRSSYSRYQLHLNTFYLRHLISWNPHVAGKEALQAHEMLLMTPPCLYRISKAHNTMGWRSPDYNRDIGEELATGLAPNL